MRHNAWRFILVVAGLLLWPWPFCLAQGVATVTNVVHVLGLEGIKRNAKCTLRVEPEGIQFEAGAARSEVKIGSIQDVFTEQDSRRLVGGKIGTVTRLAAPYGTGRLISLFREKVDVLTLEYQDANGGLHGVILTLPRGQATAIKRQLVASGVHASIPVEAEEKPEKTQDAKKP